MKIALIGVPRSGKSELAQSIAERLEQKPVIIDRYAEEIEQSRQIALGPFGDYIANLYVALERHLLERVAQLDHEIVITCGTFIETAVYLAMHFVALTETLSPEEREEAAPRIEAVLRMFAVLYGDVLDYDLIFYLPLREANADSQYMDLQLRAGLEGFKLVPVTLLNADHQLDDVMKVLEHELPAS